MTFSMMTLSIECCYAVVDYLNVMLSVAMLSVGMLNVIMLSVMAPQKQPSLKLKTWPKYLAVYLLSSFVPNPQNFVQTL